MFRCFPINPGQVVFFIAPFERHLAHHTRLTLNISEDSHLEKELGSPPMACIVCRQPRASSSVSIPIQPAQLTRSSVRHSRVRSRTPAPVEAVDSLRHRALLLEPDAPSTALSFNRAHRAIICLYCFEHSPLSVPVTAARCCCHQPHHACGDHPKEATLARRSHSCCRKTWRAREMPCECCAGAHT